MYSNTTPFAYWYFIYFTHFIYYDKKYMSNSNLNFLIRRCFEPTNSAFPKVKNMDRIPFKSVPLHERTTSFAFYHYSILSIICAFVFLIMDSIPFRRSRDISPRLFPDFTLSINVSITISGYSSMFILSASRY